MKVGFIGIGTMGGHMAYNLCKAEYEVSVHDLNRDLSKRHIEVGATWADSVKAIAAHNDVIMTSLPGPKEVQDVALKAEGLLANMKPGTVWFDLSTNSVTVVRALHAKFKEKGIHMLDAPVSGGPKGAQSGKMATRPCLKNIAKCSKPSATRFFTSATAATAPWPSWCTMHRATRCRRRWPSCSRWA
jgi:3-hydroxyisobutyrate dehydrogenase